MKFLYVDIKRICDFLYLYNNNENEMSHFNETINED